MDSNLINVLINLIQNGSTVNWIIVLVISVLLLIAMIIGVGSNLWKIASKSYQGFMTWNRYTSGKSEDGKKLSDAEIEDLKNRSAELWLEIKELTENAKLYKLYGWFKKLRK